MAKSLRSKTKRNFRRVKREDGAFAVAHAARLARLSSKLANVKSADAEGDQVLQDVPDSTAVTHDIPIATVGADDTMDIEAGPNRILLTKISTSGPRSTRRGQRKVQQKKHRRSPR